MPELDEVRKLRYPCGSLVTQIWDVCPNCGKQRWQERKRLGRRCLSCANSTRNGRRQTFNGYIQIHLNPDDFFYTMASNGYVLEHRLVMAKYLGRNLHTWEVVHHKNGIKDDNRIENLELSSEIGEHSRQHSKGYRDGFRRGYKDGLRKANT